MAMHRRVTLPTLKPSHLPVLGNATTLEQEQAEAEKTQVNAIIKSLSLDEAPSKEKHVRTLIVGTYTYNGGVMFWHLVQSYASVYSNDVVCWKFLILVHRLLMDGHAAFAKDSLPQSPFIEQVVSSHEKARAEKASYSHLSLTYARLILAKVRLHHKYPELGSNLVLKDSVLPSLDAGKSFELAVDLFDHMEALIALKKVVLSTFPPGMSLSGSPSGQCRLSAVVPSTNESSRVLDILIKLLRLLHRHLPWDTLEGHRQRFQLLYTDLRNVYEKLSVLHYLRPLIQIPKLASDMSLFFDSLHRLQDPSVIHNQQQIDDVHEEEEVVELVDVNQPEPFGILQQEYAELMDKCQNLMEALQAERQARQLAEASFQSREQHFRLEADSLKKKHELAVAAATQAAAAAAHSDEAAKLDKLKAAYQKLRTDHITVLRQKGDADKEVRELRLSANQHKDQLLELQTSVQQFISATSSNETTTATADLKSALAAAVCSFHDLNKMLADKEALIEQFRSERSSDQASRITEMDKLLDLERQISTKESFITSLEAERDNEKRLRQQDQDRVLELQKQMNDQLSQLEQSRIQQEELKGEMSQSRNLLEAEVAALRTQLGSVQAAWRSKLVWMMTKLVEHLSGYSKTELPSLETIFGSEGQPNLTSSGSSSQSDELSRTNELIFYSMMFLVKLQPYATADTVNLNQMVDKACVLLMKLNHPTPDDADVQLAWHELMAEFRHNVGQVSGIKWDPSDVVQQEIQGMQATIEEAAAALEKLMLEAKANEKQRPDIDVDLKILDSCCQLFVAIQEVIRAGRMLQNEITSEAKLSNTHSRPEFYRHNQKWSEGLISASKDIGRGAKLLVEAANAVVNDQGKFEELIAASQEIASSSAQMVVASKVKARPESQNLSLLSAGSKKVAESTAQVIATCRALSANRDQEQLNLQSLSFHQSKRLEMEIQIKVLELESQLQKQREKLFALRKLQYASHGFDEGTN